MTHSEPISSYIKFIGYFVSFFCYAIFLLYNWFYVKKTKIDRNIIQIWVDKSNALPQISITGDVENQVSSLLNPSTSQMSAENATERQNKRNYARYNRHAYQQQQPIQAPTYCVCGAKMLQGRIQQGIAKCSNLNCQQILTGSDCYYCPNGSNVQQHKNGFFYCESCASKVITKQPIQQSQPQLQQYSGIEQQQETKEEEKNNVNQYVKFEFEIKNALLRSNFSLARIIGDLINSTVIIIYFNYFTGLELTSPFGIIQLVIYSISMLFDLIDIAINLIPKTKQKIMENYVLTDSFNAKYYFIQFIHTYFNFFSLFFTIYLCHTTLSKFDTYWIITLSFTNKIKSILEIHWKTFQKLVFNYSKTHKQTKCDKVISWLIKKLIYTLSELLLYIPLFLISSSIITCFVSTNNNDIYFNGLLPIWFIVCIFYNVRKLLLYYECYTCINNYTCRKCNICFGFILISTLLACIQLGFILYCVNGKTYYYSYTSLFMFLFISFISIIICIQIPTACTFIISHLCLMCTIFFAFVSSAYGAPRQIQYSTDPNAAERPAIVKIFEFMLLLLTYFVIMPFIVMFGIWTKDIQQLFIPLSVIFVCAGLCGICQFFRGLCVCNTNKQPNGIYYVLMGTILLVFAFWFVWEFQIIDYTT
eukprot:236398_1